jgi:hypothetical protein
MLALAPADQTHLGRMLFSLTIISETTLRDLNLIHALHLFCFNQVCKSSGVKD